VPALESDDPDTCKFDEVLMFDARLALEQFVGLCGRLRLAHSGEVVAFFTLSSGFVRDHNRVPLLVQLVAAEDSAITVSAGHVQVECEVHESGEFDEQRLAAVCNARG
jgi:hypothetical protein